MEIENVRKKCKIALLIISLPFFSYLGVLGVVWLVVCLHFLPFAYPLLLMFKVIFNFSKNQEYIFYALSLFIVPFTFASFPPSIVATMFLFGMTLSYCENKIHKAERDNN